MGYSALEQKVTGDPWTSREYNQLADNLTAGVPDILTTKGDIAVATGENVAARLGVGSNGTILVAASGEATGVKWGVEPGMDLVTTKGDILVATAADTLARLAVGNAISVLEADSGETPGLQWRDLTMASAWQSGTSAKDVDTWHELVPNNEFYDTHSDYNAATGRITVPCDGYYIIGGVLYSSASYALNDSALIKIGINGSSAAYPVLGGEYAKAIYAGVIYVRGAGVFSLTAGDYASLFGYCGRAAGGTANLSATLFYASRISYVGTIS